MQASDNDEARKAANDYLTAQVYQLCDERRNLLEQCDGLK